MGKILLRTHIVKYYFHRKGTFPPSVKYPIFCFVTQSWYVLLLGGLGRSPGDYNPLPGLVYILSGYILSGYIRIEERRGVHI
jgi:hypothetical protein